MKFIYLNTKQDFAASYFARIFWKEGHSIDKDDSIWREKLVKYFGIEENKIRSIQNVNNKVRRDLFLDHKTSQYQDEFSKIEGFFRKVDPIIIRKIVKDVEKYLDKYISLLESLFLESNLPEDIKVSFLEGIDINFYNAFTYYFIPNQMYLFIPKKEVLTEEKLLAYSKTILHELTHLYLNNSQSFYNSLKSFWLKNYKGKISGNIFRTRVEEIIVNTLVNGNRDFGFSYPYIDIKNNESREKEVLGKSRTIDLTYVFLNNLKNSHEKNKLEKYLPEFIRELVKNGLFFESGVYEKKKNTRAGVYGLLIRDKELLMIKKARGPYKGKFDLPGGKIEENESLAEALKREVIEETGLMIEVKDFIAVNESEEFYKNEKGEARHLYLTGSYYFVSIPSNQEIKKIPDGRDSLGAVFIPLDKITKENTSSLAFKIIDIYAKAKKL